MRSHTSRDFRELYAQLPADVRRQARQAYRQFQADPTAEGLNFEPVAGTNGRCWTARVSGKYRAVGIHPPHDRDTILWFWTGTHNDYVNLLNQLKRGRSMPQMW